MLKPIFSKNSVADTIKLELISNVTITLLVSLVAMLIGPAACTSALYMHACAYALECAGHVRMHAVCMWYTCGVHKTMRVQFHS